VRALLELLGNVDPDRERREPVALPAWAKRLPVISAVALGLVSLLLTRAISALV
jgi:hypothetical protein